MKLKFFSVALTVSIFALLAFSQINRREFKPAEALPRGALVYAQVRDLPALLKTWNESEFKSKYLESENYKDLKNRHLGLKLASRWEEFNRAAGFPIDLETLSGIVASEAAVALYDIGKLDCVFIAPISDEIFSATKFVQNRDKFAEETLSDGTIIYRAEVEADRGRQSQQFIFTNVENLFIAATSEKLLAQTLDNIKGKAAKNSLSNEPAYADLIGKIETHSATVWVDQTILNEDYYFKRYWLMSDIAELKNFRAGIFDFEIQAGKIFERRKFLLNQKVDFRQINPAQAKEMLAHIPGTIPQYRLQSANNQLIELAIRAALFDRQEKTKREKKRRRYYPSNDFDDFQSSDYEYLDEKFDEIVSETDEDETVVQTPATVEDFTAILRSAAPQSVLTFTQPEIRAAPLFVDFRRAAIFNLALPEKFDRQLFESAIEKKLAAQTMISMPNATLSWETKSENEVTRRELSLPLLNWSVSYTVRGDYLILTDNSEFLREIISEKSVPNRALPNASFNELAELNFSRKENHYNQVLDEFDAADSDAFFTRNVAGFLDSISSVEKIEIKKVYTGNFLEEELLIYLRPTEK